MASKNMDAYAKRMMADTKRKATARRLKAERKKAYDNREWYDIRGLLGNQWAYFYFLIGGRERGKSYSVMEYCVAKWKKDHTPFVWIRLNEPAIKKMLANNAAKMVDADLYRKYHLNLYARGGQVFDVPEDADISPRGVIDQEYKMCDVLALSTAFNDKGSSLFDNEYTGDLTIVIDEFELEKGQKRTFDVSYNLSLQLENLCRSRKTGIRIFFIGNTTEEVSDIMSTFDFIPLEFGIYKLKKKRCVIDYIPNTEAYVKRRQGTVGDILAGNTSNYTNKLSQDLALIDKGRLKKPNRIIKFSKDPKEWFTIWNGNIVEKYNKEKGLPTTAMRRYIDEVFNPDLRDAVFEVEDARAFKYHSLIVQKQFRYQLSLIKKQ